nr:hypothetical protein [Pandoravirus massiliensis]
MSHYCAQEKFKKNMGHPVCLHTAQSRGRTADNGSSSSKVALASPFVHAFFESLLPLIFFTRKAHRGRRGAAACMCARAATTTKDRKRRDSQTNRTHTQKINQEKICKKKKKKRAGQ